MIKAHKCIRPLLCIKRILLKIYEKVLEMQIKLSIDSKALNTQGYHKKLVMNYVFSKHAFCKIGEFQTWKWGGCVTKKKIILTFSDISDMNEKIIFMYAGLQLTSFRCSWGFWKYIRCLMPKYNIKGNFSFQMWSYYIAWWPYMNKPLKNSYKNGSHIMH